MSMTPSRRKVESLTLADMAIDDRLFVVKCNYCRRTSHFLATDLVKVYGEKHLIQSLFNSCSTCGKSNWVHVSTRLTHLDDEGVLSVRRPKLVWRWFDAVFKSE